MKKTKEKWARELAREAQKAAREASAALKECRKIEEGLPIPDKDRAELDEWRGGRKWDARMLADYCPTPEEKVRYCVTLGKLVAAATYSQATEEALRDYSGLSDEEVEAALLDAKTAWSGPHRPGKAENDE